MAYFDSLKDLNIEQLLRKVEEVNRDNERSDQVRYTIITRCVENLTKSISSNAESSNALAQKVYYLNKILTVATIIATLIGGYELIAKLIN